jgi:hypothetical protein
MGGAAFGQEVEPEAFRPHWKVGQKWIVETVGLQSAVRKARPAATANRPVRWQFHVVTAEIIESRKCYRIQLRCLEPGEHPQTTLWVDEESMTLRQIQIQLPSPEGFRTVTESYRSDSGQPFPAISAFTVPPIDLPLFVAGAKGTNSFQYRASTSPDGAKDTANLDFSVSIQQRFSTPGEKELQRLMPAPFSKSAENKPVVEVRLRAGRSEVRQLWQAGFPWPAYSTNGVATARLIREGEASNSESESDNEP